MWTYLFGPVASLLPRRWRAALCGDWPVNWLRATMISGGVEMAAFFAALVWWYFHWVNRVVAAQMDITVEAAKGAPGEGAAYGMGAVAFISFALHPLTWVLAYFAVEGLARAFAAVAIEHSYGTLPLALIERIVRGTRERFEELRVPLVADEVTRGDAIRGWDLRVASCRAKPMWKPHLTVRYEEEMFTVTGEAPAQATPARPFVFLLKKKPLNEVARGLEDYDAETVLRAEKEPGFWQVVFGELRRKRRALGPILADQLTYKADAAGEVLEVGASRDKEDWHPGRIVFHAGSYYRIEREMEEKRPRPFLYVLRRLPVGVPGRRVIFYRPDQV